MTVTAPVKGTAFLATDPLYPGKQALHVVGTGARDLIVVTGLSVNSGSALWVLVTTPSSDTCYDATFTGQISRIVVRGLTGSDDLAVAGIITTPTWMFGGAGNDRMLGFTLGGNVLSDPHQAYALAFGMVIVIAVAMSIYFVLDRRASRWRKAVQ